MVELKPESEVSQEIQIEGPHHNCILMRNNSGALLDAEGRSVRFGLGNISKKHNDNIKSSDLIGFTKIVITQEMVGQTVAVFTACEVKKEDWNIEKKFDARERAQQNFIDWILANGGFAGFINDASKLKELLR